MDERRAIHSDRAPAAIGPYSQAMRAGEWVFLSGQIGLDPATGELVAGGTAAEAARVFANLGAVLDAAGLDFSDVVRVTVYLLDLAEFAAVNQIYAEHFGEPYPARVTVGVASLPKGARVEIEALARAR